ncbi:hypothetical protein [Aeromonas phage AS-yj]|uniref:Uncharacterized protein n=3 Tax=Ceceduovirus aszj TaxID=2843652 RepID=A0A411B7U6_9CAUD|nr:hypothetical protein HWB28_gp182 [Aeromonas phage AS-zj]ASU00370.1 hypothetical protein [Aeromonas phage AS-zj]ATI17881.1 hypothetical protein [Aeromonas phage AS-yj]QAX97660.1 hypothetical protein ASswx1_14 [Aeromonas phage Asswx_1]
MKKFNELDNRLDESMIAESKDLISSDFKNSIAKFFNTWIEHHELKFGSFEAKAKWSGEQIAKKTAIGKAAVMFAMGQNKDVVDAVMKAKK